MAGSLSVTAAGADAPPCAELARLERIDPVGSAGHYRHIVVVEIPLPWPRDISEHPQVAPHADALKAAGVRVQAVVPAPESTPTGRRLAHYWSPPGPFRNYALKEHKPSDQDLGEKLAELVEQASRAGRTDLANPAGPMSHRGHSAPPAARDNGTMRDVLICGHGKRDQCCGTMGTRLAMELDRLDLADVRVWRTSHTGGHRFAPTALVLPEGTAWAFLDGETLEGIVSRTLDVEVAAGLYRGCTGLDHPALQVCDREALRTVGWSWLDHNRTGQIMEQSDGRFVVRLEHTPPAPTREEKPQVFEAVVEVDRTLPVPECRRPLDESRKTAPEYRAVSLTNMP